LSGRDFKKSRSRAGLTFQLGWKLKKDRAQFGLQNRSDLEQFCHRLGRISEFFHMRDIAACFEGKNKGRGRGLASLGQPFFVRQPVKGIVDFHGLEMAGVVRQHF